MKKTYTMEIAGLKRDLPLFPVNDNLQIAAFILFGDVEITKASAKALLEKAPEYDIMITAECKSIPLIYEMARQSGQNDYIIARKGPKVYMEDLITTNVDSITTAHTQSLCIGKAEVELMKGKKVLIVDDVISTGESLAAIEELVVKAGGNVVGRMAILAEGNAANSYIFKINLKHRRKHKIPVRRGKHDGFRRRKLFCEGKRIPRKVLLSRGFIPYFHFRQVKRKELFFIQLYLLHFTRQLV